MILKGKVVCPCGSGNIEYMALQGPDDLVLDGKLKCGDCERSWAPSEWETRKINALLKMHLNRTNGDQDGVEGQTNERARADRELPVPARLH